MIPLTLCSNAFGIGIIDTRRPQRPQRSPVFPIGIIEILALIDSTEIR
jgi:hypothetical protein